MVALYFDKLESGVGELDRLLQIAETPANPPTDRPANPCTALCLHVKTWNVHAKSHF